MPAARYRVIVVGVDFSEPSRQAMHRALDLGRRLKARVDVIHVAHKIDPAVPFSRENRDVVAQLQQDEFDAARGELERFVPKAAGVTVRTHVLVGQPSRELLAYADQVRADLIVLSNRGLTLAEKLLIGSVADRVLRKAHTPILLVPPAGRRKRSGR